MTNDKIVTVENAEQNLSQGTRKTAVNDFVERRGGTIVQVSIPAEGFKNMTHGVVLDSHLHLVAIAVDDNLGVRSQRPKGR